MRATRHIGALLIAAALAAAAAAPAMVGAQEPRPGGTALEETVDHHVFVLGLRSLVDEVDAAGRATVGPPEQAAGPAAALTAALDQVVASSGHPPFTVVNVATCRVSLRLFRSAAYRLSRAASLAARGRTAFAASSLRGARSALRAAGRIERLCLAATARRRARLVALQPRPHGTVRATGLAFSRAAPLVAAIPRNGTLTGAACPAAADETLGVVVAYEGVLAGSTLQVAVGRFPGTGVPTVSPGLAIPQGSGTASVQVPPPVPGIATGAADGEYVAYLALNGRPMSGVRFVIDCA